MSQPKTQQSPPSILEIVNGLKKISTFNGIHVEDDVVKRRSSVALILRFPNIPVSQFPTSSSSSSSPSPSSSSSTPSTSSSSSSFTLADATETPIASMSFPSSFSSTEQKSTTNTPQQQQSTSDIPAADTLSNDASLDSFLDLIRLAISSLPNVSSSPSPNTSFYPEILFIKRTARKGDRWSGHVALPGGKRDPEDESDRACAERETWEEVGLDLSKHAHFVGPLDQRLVKTSWGRVTLMTLCPFVYVLKDSSTLGSTNESSKANGSPFLTLQPTEIDRAFWIPVNDMYRPDYASGTETVTLGDRLRLHKSPFFPKPIVSALCKVNAFGAMRFGAIDLVHPKDVIVSSSSDSTETDAPYKFIEVNTLNPPYKLWGLTHGIIVDLLEIFQPHSAAQYFQFPTLTAPDIRFFIYILSYPYVKGERTKFIKPSSNDTYNEGQLDITGKALSGYFPYLAKSIYAGLTFRVVTTIVVITTLYKRFKK